MKRPVILVDLRNKKTLMENEAIEKLKAKLVELEKTIRTEYNRSLPIPDLLSDRWERAKSLGFGKGTSIYNSAIVFDTIKVGSNTWIGPNTILDGSGGLTIGNNCSISAGVQIYSHDSVKWAISGGMEEYEYNQTDIGDNTYIGPNSIIVRGVSIGTGCIIGANSLVKENVPDGTKVAGNPSRVLGPAEY